MYGSVQPPGKALWNDGVLLVTSDGLYFQGLPPFNNAKFEVDRPPPNLRKYKYKLLMLSRDGIQFGAAGQEWKVLVENSRPLFQALGL